MAATINQIFVGFAYAEKFALENQLTSINDYEESHFLVSMIPGRGKSLLAMILRESNPNGYTVIKGLAISRPQPGCHLPNSPWPGIIYTIPVPGRFGQKRSRNLVIFFTVLLLISLSVRSGMQGVDHENFKGL